MSREVTVWCGPLLLQYICRCFSEDEDEDEEQEEEEEEQEDEDEDEDGTWVMPPALRLQLMLHVTFVAAHPLWFHVRRGMVFSGPV